MRLRTSDGGLSSLHFHSFSVVIRPQGLDSDVVLSHILRVGVMTCLIPHSKPHFPARLLQESAVIGFVIEGALLIYQNRPRK